MFVARLRCLLFVPLLAAAAPVHADPGYYVVTAYAQEGVRTLDTRYWTVKFGGQPVATWPEVGLGYGVSSRWFTELFASWIGSSATATRLDTMNWQNDFLLTQGQWPFDLALHSQLIHEYGDGGGARAIEFGPVWQTEFGRNQLNLNLFFERRSSDAQTGPTTFKYQWQVRHHWRAGLHFGVQGFGELGPWDHWSPHGNQSHRIGPAVFGSMPLGGRREFSWQAAWLQGSIYGSHGSMFSARAAYSF